MEAQSRWHDALLGELIAGLRTRAKLSQEEFARRTKTTQSTLSRIEAGSASASHSWATVAERNLGLEAGELAGLVDASSAIAERVAFAVVGHALSGEHWSLRVAARAGSGGLRACLAIGVACVLVERGKRLRGGDRARDP